MGMRRRHAAGSRHRGWGTGSGLGIGVGRGRALLAAGLLALALHTTAAEPEAAAQRLVGLINGHRQAAGLPALAVSATLTAVAQAHVRDLQRHPPKPPCNLHSWSDHGPWTACCYTADHAQARCMWAKPGELSKGRFPTDGFEISAGSSRRITPEAALALWQRSTEHDAVIRQRGPWERLHWASVGVALSENYAVAWFARETERP